MASLREFAERAAMLGEAGEVRSRAGGEDAAAAERIIDDCKRCAGVRKWRDGWLARFRRGATKLDPVIVLGHE
jgi:hypothetical protein